MSTPTQRTLKLLREEGWTVAVVEKWNPFSRRRMDLFGFADLIAYKDNDVRLVQTTVVGSHANRVAKIMCEPRASTWALGRPWRTIEVISWGKYKLKRGGKAYRWRPRREMVFERA